MKKLINRNALYEPGNPADINPGGWMRRHMEEDAHSGWLNTCEKMSREGIMQWDANSAFEVPYLLPPWKWLGNAREGWDKSVPFYQPLIDQMGAYGEGEYQGHWLDELYRMAYCVKLDGFKEWADTTVHEILAERGNPWKDAWSYGLYKGPDESGYIGTNPPYLRFTGMYQAPVGILSGAFEMSGMSEVLTALLLYYGYTNQRHVLDAVIKCADLIVLKISGRETMGTSGGPLMASMLAKLYLLAPKKEYIDLAIKVADHFTLPLIEKIMKGGFALKHYHTATIGIIMLANQDIYEATGEVRFLEASESLSENVCRYGLQPHGSGTASHELLDDRGPAKNTEGCDTAWFIMAWSQLVRLTGNSLYADLAERAAYNALPGHRSKDGLANPYYTRPNQLFAVRSDGQGTVMAARLIVECCMGNLGRSLPFLLENAVLHGQDNDGLCIPFYAEGTYDMNIGDGDVTVSVESDYPFDGNIRITMSIPDPSDFPVKLRIPVWCSNPLITINGLACDAKYEKGWCILRHSWCNGDVISITLPMEVYIEEQNGLISIYRGPLLYALPVEGSRTVVDRWGSFEEIPNERSAWNYALMIDKNDVASSFTYLRCEENENTCVWEAPHAVLSVRAVRLPLWCFDRPVEELIPEKSTDAPEPPFSKNYLAGQTPPETVQLVPYGCTVLRMTCLPYIDK